MCIYKKIYMCTFYAKSQIDTQYVFIWYRESCFHVHMHARQKQNNACFLFNSNIEEFLMQTLKITKITFLVSISTISCTSSRISWCCRYQKRQATTGDVEKFPDLSELRFPDIDEAPIVEDDTLPNIPKHEDWWTGRTVFPLREVALDPFHKIIQPFPPERCRNPPLHRKGSRSVCSAFRPVMCTS